MPPVRLKSFGQKFNIVLLEYDFGMNSADSMNLVDLFHNCLLHSRGNLDWKCLEQGSFDLE